MIEEILAIIRSHTVFAVIGTVASLMAAFTAQYCKKIAARRLGTQKETIRQTIAAVSRDLGTLRISRALARQPADTRESSEALLQKLEQLVLRRVSAEPDKTEDRIKEDVQNEMSEFGDRIEKIERRSPDDIQLERIAAIKDAILSERIDQLSEKIDRLENRALSHWDVAITVSTIIGGIFAVVAAICALLIFIADGTR